MGRCEREGAGGTVSVGLCLLEGVWKVVFV